MQVSAPGTSANVPDGQDKQLDCCDSGWNDPAAQRSQEELPLCDMKDPPGQGEQAARAVSAANFPSLHSVHSSDPGCGAARPM